MKIYINKVGIIFEKYGRFLVYCWWSNLLHHPIVFAESFIRGLSWAFGKDPRNEFREYLEKGV